MVDERRRDSRARSGGAVRCEGATGKALVSRWRDLGSGGLFVETDDPTPVGTLLTIEFEIPGERAAASAAGRVTWVRDAPSGDGKPPGMGVTFIDIDETVRASIGRFLAREAPSEATAQSPNALPSRERTVLGVGLSAQTSAAASPRAPMPSREKTVLGVAPVTRAGPEDQPRQHTAKRGSLHDVDDLPDWPDEPPELPKAAHPAAAPATQPQRHELSDHAEKTAAPEASPAARRVHRAPGDLREASLSPPVRRSTGGRVGALVFLLLLLTLAGGGYGFRARLRPWIARYTAFRTASAPVATTPIGTPGGSSLPSLAAGESATAITLAASPSANAKIDVDAGARAQPAVPNAGADAGVAKAPTYRPPPHAPKHRPAVATQSGADVED